MFRSLSESTLSSFESPGRKRSRDEIDDLPKRSQYFQIHSEAHISTVKMMMDALRRQKDYLIVEEPQEEENFTTTQKPFWPQITKTKS